MIWYEDSPHPDDAIVVYVKHPDGEPLMLVAVPADEEPDELERLKQAVDAVRERAESGRLLIELPDVSDPATARAVVNVALRRICDAKAGRVARSMSRFDKKERAHLADAVHNSGWPPHLAPFTLPLLSILEAP